MKYIVLLCDGMADYPIPELGGRTPLEAANKPAMDELVKTAEVGLAKTVPDGMKPGSDVANLSVMGYDPAKYYTGRSPLEAANMGISLDDCDVAIRCNLVTLSDDEDFESKTMVDYCAGDISSAEAAEIIKSVNEYLGNEKFSFYPGVSYRHCMIWKNGSVDIGNLTPPHDISGRIIGQYLDRDEGAAELIEMMKKSGDLLKNHPVNLKRIAQGKRPATHIWLWGQGKKAVLDDFYKKNRLKGSVVSAVDLVQGIGTCANMNVVKVEGATGYIDTNFAGKMQAAFDQLKNGQDYVYIHVEAPDECGHRGEIQNKVRAIEEIDRQILAPLVERLKGLDDYTILIMPDHPTPLSTMTHASDPVPYMLYRSNKPVQSSGVFSEKSAKDSGIYVDKAHLLIDKMKEN